MTALFTRLLAAALLSAVAAIPTAAQVTVTRADVVAQLTGPGTATDFGLAGEAVPPDLQALADRSGGGQTWDLTPFAWEPGTTSSYGPAMLPVPGSDIEGLGAATHVLAFTEGDSTSYGFFRVTDDAYDFLGVTAEVEDEETAETVTAGAVFRPFDRTFPIPLTTASTWSSTYEFVLVPPFDGFETEVTETSAVEGWGTLVTPAGTLPVLKVRTKTVSTATITVPGQDPVVTTDSSFTVEFVSRAGVGALLFLNGEGVAEDASYNAFGSGGGTAGEAPPEAAPLALALRSANPARRGAAVEVSFMLSGPADVRLDVFDALGRRVASRADGVRAAGERRTLLPTDGLPAGVYTVRLAAGVHAGSVRFTVVE